jgi:hypothetical protein
MAVSKWNMFKQLFKKEWDQVKLETYFVLASALTVNLAVVVFNIKQVAPLYAFVLMAPFLVPLYSTVQLFRREWSEGSIYLLLSLPVNGGPVFFTKLLAILLEFIVQTAGAYGMTFLFAYIFEVTSRADLRWALTFSLSEHGSPILQAAVMTSLVMIAGMALLASAIFLSQSLGRLVRKYQGLCTFASFLFLLWLAGKIAVGTGDLVFRFTNLANIPHTAIPQVAALWQITAFVLATEVLITALYLAATAYIYDTKLEL